MERVVDASGAVSTAKRDWAAGWWKDVLLVMDWLPDEQRIRIRGPGFDFLHKYVYGPLSRAFGMFLSYKMWKSTMAQGIVDVCKELPGSDVNKVRCGRAANHSNFPECTECFTRRNRWLSAAKSVKSDPAVVKVSDPQSGPPSTPIALIIRRLKIASGAEDSGGWSW